MIGFISVFSEIYTTKKHIEAPSHMCDFEVTLESSRNLNCQNFNLFHNCPTNLAVRFPEAENRKGTDSSQRVHHSDKDKKC